MTKEAKMIPYLWNENLKNHTLSRGTYPLNPYMRRSPPPPPPSPRVGQYAERVSHMNLVNGLARHRSLVAQWRIRFPSGTQTFSSLRNEHFIFIIHLPSLNFTISHCLLANMHLTSQTFKRTLTFSYIKIGRSRSLSFRCKGCYGNPVTFIYLNTCQYNMRIFRFAGVDSLLQ